MNRPSFNESRITKHEPRITKSVAHSAGCFIIISGLGRKILLNLFLIMKSKNEKHRLLQGAELIKRAQELGVSLEELCDSSGNLSEPELQRRVIEAEKALGVKAKKPKQSKNAWILFIGTILAAVITGVFSIYSKAKPAIDIKENATNIEKEIKEIPSNVLISRLIESYDIELQRYLNEFKKNLAKIEDDFINRKSPISPMDETIFNDAKLDVKNKLLDLQRNIQDLLLKKFETIEFKNIESLSMEYKKYQSVVEKTESIKKEITEMEEDPRRITSLFNRINNMK
jgi:hypothetical protein